MESANPVPKYTKFELPDDLVPVFLAELPVKSLLRFRCVSKSWNSVVSDPEFSKLQHKPPCLLLHELEKAPFGFTIWNLANNCKHSVDFSWTRSNFEILGSCNGLICVRQHYDLLIVANPSTRKFKHVETDSKGRLGLSSFGFGFDKSVDDYKLVRADPIKPPIGIPRTEIYVLQLKSTIWRKIQDTDWRIKHNEHGVLLDGALHWTGYSWQDRYCSRPFVVVLDLATEKFKTILIPELDHYYYSSVTLSTIGGFLCLCSMKSSKINIWIMKEHGVTSSWSKLVTIPEETVTRYGYPFKLTPLLFSEEDEIVATINGGHHGAVLVRFNIKTLKFNNILLRKLSPLLIGRHTIMHRESLVSI